MLPRPEAGRVRTGGLGSPCAWHSTLPALRPGTGLAWSPATATTPSQPCRRSAGLGSWVGTQDQSRCAESHQPASRPPQAPGGDLGHSLTSPSLLPPGYNGRGAVCSREWLWTLGRRVRCCDRVAGTRRLQRVRLAAGSCCLCAQEPGARRAGASSGLQSPGLAPSTLHVARASLASRRCPLPGLMSVRGQAPLGSLRPSALGPSSPAWAAESLEAPGVQPEEGVRGRRAEPGPSCPC